jgi:hypothetical protein
MSVLIYPQSNINFIIFINCLFLEKLLKYTYSNLIKIEVNCFHVILSICLLEFVKIREYTRKEDVTYRATTNTCS